MHQNQTFVQSCWAANAILSPKIFVVTPLGIPKMVLQKTIFWTAEAKGDSFFYISRYLREKYFNIVLWYHPPKTDPPVEPSRNQFFERP